MRVGRRKAIVWAVAAVGIVVAVVAAVAGNLDLAVAAAAVLAGLAAFVGIGAWEASRATNRRVERLAKRVHEPHDVEPQLQELTRHVSRVKEQLRRDLVRDLREQTKQIEALLQVLPRFGDHPVLPPSGSFALDARSLAELADIVVRERPQLVVELGSGTSTVWIAHQLKATGGRLVSIDHDPKYAAATRYQLDLQSLSDVAEVNEAPLVARAEGTPWYDESAFAGLTGIDLLLVDGPPGSTGPHARRPALEVLREALSPGATVILDDVVRDEEKEILDEWMARWPEFVRIDAGISSMAVLKDSTPS